jgi:hypothetical protein
MTQRAGLVDSRFSQAEPFWCADGVKQGGNLASDA